MSPAIGSDAYGEFMSLLHLMSTELYPTNNLAFGGNVYAQTPEQDAFIVATATERADRLLADSGRRLAKPGHG